MITDYDYPESATEELKGASLGANMPDDFKGHRRPGGDAQRLNLTPMSYRSTTTTPVTTTTTTHSRSKVTEATCVGRTVPGGIFMGRKSMLIASLTGVVITFWPGRERECVSVRE